MAQSDELMKGFQVGYQNAPFASLGQAIKSTIGRLQTQEDTVSGLYAKGKIESMFQDPLDRQYKQAQLSNLGSEQELKKAQIAALNNFQQGQGQPQSTGGSPLSQFNIPEEEQQYYYPAQPKYTNVSGVPVQTGYEDPKLTQEGEAYYTKIKESQKPKSDIEAGVISKAETIPGQIDDLIALINKPGSIFGVTPLTEPWGASRISAFGESGPYQSIKRGFTFGAGRKAGLLLQNVKVLAFGEAGKALTTPEKEIVMAKLNPAYKTEKEWISDLESASQLLIRKAELMGGNMKNPFSKKTQVNDNSALGKELVRRGL